MSHPPARRHRCRQCRAWTLVGLDEDQCGFTATTDPHPITAAGEAIARLINLLTYDLDHTGHLWLRTRYDITARPAEHDHPIFPGIVVTEHQCGTDWTKYHATKRKEFRNRKEDNNAGIPF